MSRLAISELAASVGETAILRGLDLVVGPGEVHAIMGPNGSGKSTLAGVLAGRPDIDVTAGSVRIDDDDLLELDPHERAIRGLFLAFQYPVELPGVTMSLFLREALNAQRTGRDLEPIDPMTFVGQMRAAAARLEIDSEFLKRDVNVGFSGGEKKRAEMLQLLLFKPRLVVMDETDSGLDIDALKLVSRTVNELRDSDRSIVMITHYQRLLEHIVPDRVHVLMDGRIVCSGGSELALELERSGYESFRPAAA